MYKKINRSMQFIAIFTLIISTTFVLLTCYSIFSNRLTEEIKNNDLMISDIINHSSDYKSTFENIVPRTEDRKFLLLSSDGNVISGKSSEDNLSDNPEFADAQDKGIGENMRFSLAEKAITYYCAIRLENGNIMISSSPIHTFWLTIVAICLPILIALMLIYRLSVSISSRVTENIIRPIEESYSFNREDYDDMYVEIQPFLKRIAQQNKAIRHNMEELKNAEKIRREFSANVSHELKTPLTSIKGYSQLINNGIAKPENILQFTQKIEKEAGHLIILIEDIIKLSHLDNSDIQIEKTDINLLSIANDVSERLFDIANKRNIKISVKGSDTFISANEIQISELVYNLIDNAVKYNKENGTVTVNVGCDDKSKFISVSDTGIGIPEKYLDRIFERFFKVDKSHSKTINGTGLGLSIVKHIAIINDARIEVKSKENEGTTFKVKFS